MTMNRTVPVWVLAAGIAAAVAGTAVVSLAVGYVVWVGPSRSASAPAPTLTRDQFKAAVMGKTPDEVVKKFGRPSRTSEVLGDDVWYFQDIAYDPVANRTDWRTQVVFRNGRVIGVNY